MTTLESSPQTKANPFDPSSLRLSQNFTAMVSVTNHILTIPVRKPHRQEFVRTSPNPEHWFTCGLLELHDTREIFLVVPSLCETLKDDIAVKELVLTINRQDDAFFWVIKVPDQDGNLDTWNASAKVAALMAKDTWIKVASKKSLASYSVVEPKIVIPEPQFPDLTMQEFLEKAFKGRLIDSLEHPVIKKLRGEM